MASGSGWLPRGGKAVAEGGPGSGASAAAAPAARVVLAAAGMVTLVVGACGAGHATGELGAAEAVGPCGPSARRWSVAACTFAGTMSAGRISALAAGVVMTTVAAAVATTGASGIGRVATTAAVGLCRSSPRPWPAAAMVAAGSCACEMAATDG